MQLAFNNLFGYILTALCDFLLDEPICYITVCLVLAVVIKTIFIPLINLKR